MGRILSGFIFPTLLLAVGLLNWSLISFINLVICLVFRFVYPKRGFQFRGRSLFFWSVFTFSVLVIILQLVFLALCTFYSRWGIQEAYWIKLIGLMRISRRSPTAIYFLVLEILVGALAFIEMNRTRFSFLECENSCWTSFPSVVEHIGYRLRLASCLLLPAVQLASGISNPSWLSLPFFICSSIGLVDWSLTSNFLGLFRWWRLLWVYSIIHICILYMYQLPIQLPHSLGFIAESVGLYKLSMVSDFQEICSSIFILAFYLMLSSARHDLEDMEFVMSMTESGLTDQLLPSRSSFFVRQLSSGVRHTNILLRGTVFRFFSINWFTYGFPISLFALLYWSFHFASICAFGLLMYVGYILYTFPSFFRLHRLNGLLLAFILLWAASTYVFNVVFAYVNWKAGKDMEIWEMIGLWRYPIPAFFLLAQFCLGILVALGNLVNNSVFFCLSSEGIEFSNETEEVKEDTKVLIIATVAWGLRKCSRPIILLLIFLIAMKPGIIHALYMIFFFSYLLINNVDKRMGQALILLCEAHFAVLYIIQLNLVSKLLERQGSISSVILQHLGLLGGERSWEFMQITLLACFCAINNRGFELLFSFSAVVQKMPSRPFGFSILKAGLNKSVLLSVYSTSSMRDHSENHSHERRIALYLSAIGKKFLLMYRSFGTYIAFVTVLLALYFERPNYISFGYLFLLLFWIIGRQLVEKTKRRLWFPLKAYAVAIFVFIYALSILPSFKSWMSSKINLEVYCGYNPDASLLENLWESLAIVIVMQLYSYERRQSEFMKSEVVAELQLGIFGFIKRVLIWHSQKILLAMLFYASLSPISLFGFLYLIGLICSCPLHKTSRLPSKLFLMYTGLLVLAEYLFQMWGGLAEMFPGQKHQDLSIFLGFQLYKHGFKGIEAGLRPRVLVIASCALQYNVFVWTEATQKSLLHAGRSEEPCPLFLSEEDISIAIPSPQSENQALSDSSQLLPSEFSEDAWPSFIPDDTRISESSSSRKYSSGFLWGSLKESNKWNKKTISFLRQERYAVQIKTLKVYLKFWVENMFKLFGLEINMLALLFASFALLNVVSMFYIICLALCILLGRPIIRKLWPAFAVLFALILLLEYVAMWKNMTTRISPDANVHCHDCWKNSKAFLQFCEKCWFGIVVDDPFVLTSYFFVFILACYKLRADSTPGFSWSSTYRVMLSQRKIASVWRDLSFETKGMWTFLDYLRVYCYCHLLDVVLTLVLITGTFEYDILHLGYLVFALFFFRSRFSILKKKNKVFKYLRIYNFAVIVLSLAYQSPFIGDFSDGKCDTIDYIYEVIGFYKYGYGFQVTSRSALVEIIIFVLVSCQSYMFASSEFDYVFRYLEAEQIGAIVREQEKKALWKTEQLQRVRESEERKKQRNLQVEKMKSEMLNLQSQLQGTSSSAAGDNTPPAKEKGLRRRKHASFDVQETENAEKRDSILNPDSMPPLICESPRSFRGESPFELEFVKQHTENSVSEITEIWEDASDVDFHESCKVKRDTSQSMENPLASAVQLIGDGVSQVQSIGNQAVSNLVSFLNIIPEDLDPSNPLSTVDELSIDGKTLDIGHSEVSASSLQYSESTSLQIGWIIRHIWSQMRSNNDVVCYCCFVLVFLWNFSLLSMVYLFSLFMYALCVNTGPSYIFWVIMLIYTEIYVLLQYLYQITIQHCGFTIQSDLLCKLGFPTDRIKSSFVICLLPLFLVYLFTLIQSSITAKDSEWFSIGFGNSKAGIVNRQNFYSDPKRDKAKKVFQLAEHAIKMVISSCSRYWKSLTQEAESPPYFVQLSMDVEVWPEDGIQPERIESGINELLKLLHEESCKNENPNPCPCASKVQIRSIDKSAQNPCVALAVFEVVYVSSLTECIPAEQLKSLTPASDVAKEIIRAKSLGFTKEIRFPYTILSVIGGGKREVDLYAYIFGADLSVFFLVSIFYQSVIKNKSEFLEYYQLEDQFPKEYVFILMVIFFLIVLDRIIYLCSFATGKVIFFVFNFILFTSAVTEYAWNMETSQQSAAGLALRAIYLTKAVSFALQAIQIRYGVPHQSTLYRQFLTSEVSHVNYLGYRLYRALPFLYELRCVLDWSCTTTSLTMYDWLKLEDINASLYLVKCDNDLNRAKHKHGEKQTKMTKFCNGICLFFILICVIWAPMLMYSSGNPTNIANPINDASFQLDIKTRGGRLTLYQTTLCERISWDSLSSNSDLDPQNYLDSYNVNDIQLLCCQSDASTLWLVPGVVQQQFIRSLNSGSLDMVFSWLLTRDRPKGKESVKYEGSVDPSNLPDSSEVERVLNGSLNSFRIRSIYPRFFRVTGSGEVRPFEPEVNDVTAELVLHRGSSQWWSFHDVNFLDAYGCGELSGPMAVVVSEETPQGFLGETLSKFSIWGLYITFVLAVGRFIRMQCSDLRMRIPYENLPSCDRLIGICEDIYAARAEGELGVEEVLYWSLVKIYRSPHFLLEYTKLPD